MPSMLRPPSSRATKPLFTGGRHVLVLSVLVSLARPCRLFLLFLRREDGDGIAAAGLQIHQMINKQFRPVFSPGTYVLYAPLPTGKTWHHPAQISLLTNPRPIERIAHDLTRNPALFFAPSNPSNASNRNFGRSLRLFPLSLVSVFQRSTPCWLQALLLDIH